MSDDTSSLARSCCLDIPPHSEGSLYLPVHVPERGKAALLLSYHLTEEAAPGRKSSRRLLPWL